MSEQKSPFRQDCLAGKFAIVTGGGSGIGYGIVKELLRHGCAGVLICGRRESFLQRAAASLANEASSPSAKCLYKTCDVRDPERKCRSHVISRSCGSSVFSLAQDERWKTTSAYSFLL
jgi:NAD(P)-dependent dehydrogenase (short-subunit alcohol dehydrogenase family)